MILLSKSNRSDSRMFLALLQRDRIRTRRQRYTRSRSIKGPREKALRLSDVKAMFREMEGSGGKEIPLA
jgi:hypothetical protein